MATTVGAPQLGVSLDPPDVPPQPPVSPPEPVAGPGASAPQDVASGASSPQLLALGPPIQRKVLAVIYNPNVHYRLTGGAPGTIVEDLSAPNTPFLTFALANLNGDVDSSGYLVMPEFYAVEDTASGSGLITQFRDWIDSTVTGGRVSYDVVATRTILHFPKKVPDGGGASYTITRAEYTDCINAEATQYSATPLPMPQKCNDLADYQDILSDISDLCTLANSGAIDEVWLFGAPYMGFDESTIVGPRGFPLNSRYEKISAPACNKMVPMMGFAYNRDYSMMMHSFGHRAEAAMARVYRDVLCAYGGGYNWDRFNRAYRFDDQTCDISTYPAQTEPYGCGSIHFAPGSTANGVTGGVPSTSSTCEEFANYPYLRGATTNVDSSNWGSTQADYYTWWFQHLPRNAGVNKDYVPIFYPPDFLLNDWWQYVIDINSIERPPDQPGSFVAQYYAGRNLDDGGARLPEWVQYEATIDYAWGRDRPSNVPTRVTAIAASDFSVRWGGKISLDEPGTYVFSVAADEGVRLRVDLNGDGTIDPATETVVDDWTNASRDTEFRVERAVTGTPGDRAMVLEYWDQRATGPVRFTYYHRCTAPSGRFCASYYSNKDLTGIPVREQIEVPWALTTGRGISHQWGTGGPEGLSNRFSARWEGDIDFGPTMQQVTFNTNCDDGVRLYVDGVLVIDDWSNHHPRLKTQTLDVSGTRRILVEYYENSSEAQAEFFWNRSPRIFNEAQLSGYAIANGRYVQKLEASDPDANPVSFSLDSGPTGMTVTSSGRVTWAPVGIGGTYQYVARASDGQLWDTATRPLTVFTVAAKGDLGQVAVGSARQMTFSLYNSGGGYLITYSMSFSSGDVGEYRVVWEDCVNNPLPPSDGSISCHVTVELTPIRPGTQSAVLSLYSNAANSPFRIGFYGDGT